MNKLKRFEDYEYTNDEMIVEEWKLPTQQDSIKKKLSFLKTMDLSKLNPPATHQTEIKTLWRKIMKKLYNRKKYEKYIDIVDNSDVYSLTNTLKVITEIKKSLVDKSNIGFIVYDDDKNNFYYEESLSFNK